MQEDTWAQEKHGSGVEGSTRKRAHTHTSARSMPSATPTTAPASARTLYTQSALSQVGPHSVDLKVVVQVGSGSSGVRTTCITTTAPPGTHQRHSVFCTHQALHAAAQASVRQVERTGHGVSRCSVRACSVHMLHAPTRVSTPSGRADRRYTVLGLLSNLWRSSGKLAVSPRGGCSDQSTWYDDC